MPIKNVKILFMLLFITMFFVFIPIIHIRGTSVFECPSDFLDFMPKQEHLNIMYISSER